MNRPQSVLSAAASSRRNDVDSLLARAQASHQMRRFDEAKALYGKILRKHPDHFDALLLLGCCEHDSGATEVGAQLIRRAIAVQPRSAVAHCNLGIMLFALKQVQDAVACLDKAVTLHPTFAEAHYRLGLALYELKRFDEAINSFDKALSAEPRRAAALMSKGNAHHALGQLEAAIACYDQAIAMKPQYDLALINRGAALLDYGEVEKALADLDRAVTLAPKHGSAWVDRGKALVRLGRFAEGFASYENALAIDAGLVEAWAGQAGVLLEVSTDLHAARAACERALVLDPNSVGALVRLAECLSRMGQPDAAADYCDRALAIRPAYEPAMSFKIFYLDYSVTTDVARQQLARADWWRQIGIGIFERFRAPHVNDRTCDRRIVLGYVSGDFNNRSPAYSFRPVLQNHDKSKFEVICYSTSTRQDEVTESFRRVADRWRDAGSWTDDRLAECIRDDKVDVLVDLSGHTAGNRLRVFARKPAPVQVTAWGFGTGTGVRTIDYMFSDPVALPAADRPCYAEQIHDLPSFMIMDPPPAELRSTEPPLLANGYVTYGVFNRVGKFSDEAVSVWARILQADATGRLLIKDSSIDDESIRRMILDRFKMHGIEPERVALLGSTSREDHLRAFGLVDICLDPFPQNGGISTWEALHMGVPVVTKLGTTIASRCAGAILSAVSMADWVANDDIQYVGVARAATPERLAALRNALPGMIAERCSPAAYARAVEDGYRIMWAQYCATSCAT